MPSQKYAVGERLRRIRGERQLSLAAVAQKAGISVATLSRVETEKQSVDVSLLLTLASILGVTASEILGEHDKVDDSEDLIRRMSRLRPEERTRIYLTSVTQRQSMPLSHMMTSLLATADALREEVLNAQQILRRRGRR
jgi:transcriptional regulator with XRE-family HTH domain